MAHKNVTPIPGRTLSPQGGSGEQFHADRARHSFGAVYARGVARLRLHPESQFLILAAAVGAAGALGNAVFRKAIRLSQHVFEGGTNDLVHRMAPELTPVLIVMVPFLGGAVIGVMSRLLREDVGGYAMPSFLAAVHAPGIGLRLRSMLWRTLAAIVTLGSGGSAGVEGPVATMGGGIGAWIARRLHFAGERLRVMVACGSSAAIAAAYGAPIAGVFFTQEIVLAGNYELHNFVRVVMASGAATIVSRALQGDEPVFHVPTFTLSSPLEFAGYLILGVWCGLVGAAFAKCFFLAQRTFARSRFPPILRPAIGGLLVGSIAVASPGVLGDGADLMQQFVALTDHPGGQYVLLVLGLLIAKIVATSLTIGSGGGGGVFGPALLLGACLGVCVGSTFQQVLPEVSGPPGQYAMIGMGALLAATARAPLTALFLVFEMTGSSSNSVLPALLAIASAVYVARRLERHSIDERSLSELGIRLNPRRESAVLRELSVEDAMERTIARVPGDLPAPHLQRYVSESTRDTFIVEDARGDFIGMLSLEDLRQLDRETAKHLGSLAIACDLARRDVQRAFPDESLADAVARMELSGQRALPVMDRERAQRVVGVLEQRHVLTAYLRAANLSKPGAAPADALT